ncbi:hypothetical protein CYMTET_6862 [Cymbomonas tetramitiformis]|uniref:Uncharacterized protein n=1 Tax=Cymbomonas tetramitiformis TaxID=36881 RepID=A0AAE0GWR7_9CHLO|nr:hypothetical protein CYMTET_6862 [Cymbomonas tetramitiformis]
MQSTSSTKSKGVLRGLIRTPKPASHARSADGSVSASGGVGPPASPKFPPEDPILRHEVLVLEKPLGVEVSPMELFEDTSRLETTPYRKSHVDGKI